MAGKMDKIRAAAQAASLSKALTSSRAIGAWTIAVLIFLATVVSFTQSYRGLLDFASNYLMIPRPFNWTWPLMVDTFLAVGEICLFICAVDGEKSWRLRGWFWVLTLAGLVASVTGNIMHNGLNEPGLRMAGYAVPPIAAMAILGAGLGLVKRAVAKVREVEKAAAAEAARPRPVAAPPVTPMKPPAVKIKPREDDLTRRRRNRKRLLDSDPELQGIVVELRRKITEAGEHFTDRQVAQMYGRSRHMGGVLLRAALQEGQEAASG